MMKNFEVEYSWLKNSIIKGINQLPEHSEHFFYNKYVDIKQFEYFQMDMIRLKSNWIYKIPDFNTTTSNNEQELVTLFNNFKAEDTLINKKNILKLRSFNFPFYIWLNGSFVGFSKGFERYLEFEITNLLRPDSNELIIKVYPVIEEAQNNNLILDPIMDKISESIIYSIPNLHVYNIDVVLDNKQNFNKSIITINSLLNGYSDSAENGIYIYDKERKMILKDNVDYTNKLDKKYNLDTNYSAISFIKLLVIDDGTVVETAIKKVN